jgi:hypothetical protein
MFSYVYPQSSVLCFPMFSYVYPLDVGKQNMGISEFRPFNLRCEKTNIRFHPIVTHHGLISDSGVCTYNSYNSLISFPIMNLFAKTAVGFCRESLPGANGPTSRPVQ